jgi:hypothetical protein
VEAIADFLPCEPWGFSRKSANGRALSDRAHEAGTRERTVPLRCDRNVGGSLFLPRPSCVAQREKTGRAFGNRPERPVVISQQS